VGGGKQSRSFSQHRAWQEASAAAQPLRPAACARTEGTAAAELSPGAALRKQKPSAFSRARRLSDAPPSSQQLLLGYLLGYERGGGTVGYQRLERRLPTSTAVVAPAGERAEAWGGGDAAEAGAALPAAGEDPFQAGSALRKHQPCFFLVTQHPRTEVFSHPHPAADFLPAGSCPHRLSPRAAASQAPAAPPAACWAE